ncbi:hypothetical protein Pyn_31251 [Prunus yedoensis var. nudiflora]|uniref:Uncharacterized protein n=1 Tax=Prunus yedoensis var. nudiflora TaxID=2094558 RepID=A0A314YIL5_PRUYE|nr:hypothetical protein Pyn_31251 [Prunus yedoensis var. nudiflora]
MLDEGRAEEKNQLGTGLMLRSDVGKQNGEQILRRTLQQQQQQQLVKQSFYLHGIIYKIDPIGFHRLISSLIYCTQHFKIQLFDARYQIMGLRRNLLACKLI